MEGKPNFELEPLGVLAEKSLKKKNSPDFVTLIIDIGDKTVKSVRVGYRGQGEQLSR